MASRGAASSRGGARHAVLGPWMARWDDWQSSCGSESCCCLGAPQYGRGSPMPEDHDLDEAIARMQAATREVINGRTDVWAAMCSHRADTSLFGGWGGHERGWEELGPRYEWAAARFAGGEVTFEELSRFVSDDLACTVHLERSRALDRHGTARAGRPARHPRLSARGRRLEAGASARRPAGRDPDPGISCGMLTVSEERGGELIQLPSSLPHWQCCAVDAFSVM
jgi:hypothetical protein